MKWLKRIIFAHVVASCCCMVALGLFMVAWRGGWSIERAPAFLLSLLMAPLITLTSIHDPRVLSPGVAGFPRGSWVLVFYASYGLPMAAIIWRLRCRDVIRNRSSAGLCATCGYDLRAAPDRCPECGTPIPPKQPIV